ncbi:MAG: large-conductance mechanosensitive channel protein MscL [Alphaproteobacteria bacterium]|nr:large-conductance mechanosensitive channel protein MscL [Alphaproteobacteria bacterium]
MKNFLNEFKKFAMRGNVIDMAVGIIIGAAFGKIVNSLVEDVLMPPIGLLLGKVDFSDLKLTLTNDVSIRYGAFINALISFIIVAFAVFLLIKAINTLQERMAAKEAAAEAAAPTTKTCPYCFSEISINATRCPHCTSELKAEKKAAEKKAAPKKKKAK